MRAVIQRVTTACVTVDGIEIGKIDHGLLVLLAVHQNDTEIMIPKLADKILKLRIWGDEANKMNRSLIDTNGQMMVVSQFTLYADTKKGNRPSFTEAADKEKAERFYELFIQYVRNKGIHVETGVFGAIMDVSLTNSGPATIIMDA